MLNKLLAKIGSVSEHNFAPQTQTTRIPCLSYFGQGQDAGFLKVGEEPSSGLKPHGPSRMCSSQVISAAEGDCTHSSSPDGQVGLGSPYLLPGGAPPGGDMPAGAQASPLRCICWHQPSGLRVFFFSFTAFPISTPPCLFLCPALCPGGCSAGLPAKCTVVF